LQYNCLSLKIPQYHFLLRQIFIFNKMRKIILLLLLAFTFLLTDADAQNRRKPVSKKQKQAEAKAENRSSDQKEELKTFKDRLWFGGGVGLGGFNNTFYANVSPMVGYKLLPMLSIGPRLDYDFNSVKAYGTDNMLHRANLHSYSLGAFTRVKIWNGIFAQGEFSRENKQYALSDQSGYLAVQNSKVLTTRRLRYVPSVGLGYNRGGGGLGSDLYVMFDLVDDPNSTQSPYHIRFGFTYKF
jgi:hypothetical protein